MKITEKYSVQIQMSVVLCMAIAGYMIGKYYAFLPWSFDVAMVSLVFLAFADWMRRSDFMNKNYFYTLVLPLAVWIYFLQMGIHIELATRSYPYGILSIIEAIAGSLVIISCSKLLERCKVISIFFAWCGKNSMIILILHCLEMMYFDWENLVYNRLPFTVYGFRIFIIKITVILLLTLLYDLIKKGCNFARINCVSK
jgi:fucose 4-O-acetylase-like acetyltransferase